MSSGVSYLSDPAGRGKGYAYLPSTVDEVEYALKEIARKLNAQPGHLNMYWNNALNKKRDIPPKTSSRHSIYGKFRNSYEYTLYSISSPRSDVGGSIKRPTSPEVSPYQRQPPSPAFSYKRPVSPSYSRRASVDPSISRRPSNIEAPSIDQVMNMSSEEEKKFGFVPSVAPRTEPFKRRPGRKPVGGAVSERPSSQKKTEQKTVPLTQPPLAMLSKSPFLEKRELHKNLRTLSPSQVRSIRPEDPVNSDRESRLKVLKCLGLTP